MYSFLKSDTVDYFFSELTDTHIKLLGVRRYIYNKRTGIPIPNILIAF